ncbi:hypothetical protein DINM_006844 [Dirofilaria immitis]|nr:hypothetical protein [Dirofilaria immitis]
MQILSTLLFISLCSVVIINGTPITTTPEGKINNVEFDEAGEYSNSEFYRSKEKIKLTEDTNSEVLNLLTILKIMENADPAEDPLKMSFAIFRNNDLLPLRSISQSFNVFITDVLLKRIRPLIIKNFKIASPIDRRFLPAYEIPDDIENDTLVLARCQSKFLFNISDGLESAKHELGEGAYLAKWLGFWPPIEYIIFNNSNFWLCGNAIFIPKAYVSNIAGFEDTINWKREYISKNTTEWERQEAKLVFIFSDCSWSLMESVVFSDIFRSEKTVLYLSVILDPVALLINLSKSIIICIREIFDIEPFSMNFPAEWGKVIGLVHHNSTTNSLNDGQAKHLVEMLEDKDVKTV